MKYNTITPSYAYDKISQHWNSWMKEYNIPINTNWVVAISGGKDSTVVAALAVKKFGKDKVIGVTLPCDGQDDFSDSMDVIRHLGIRHIHIDIGDAVSIIIQGLENNAIEPSYDTMTNLPARIRMATTFAIAQSVGGMVLNTSNLSESVIGYCSIFGDDCGSYAPIKGLTVTEVIKLGEWLDIPTHLIHKTPSDGLQPFSDEEKLGMSYSNIDNFIRKNEGTVELKEKIHSLQEKNLFKTEIVRVPGYMFSEELENFLS